MPQQSSASAMKAQQEAIRRVEYCKKAQAVIQAQTWFDHLERTPFNQLMQLQPPRMANYECADKHVFTAEHHFCAELCKSCTNSKASSNCSWLSIKLVQGDCGDTEPLASGRAQ